ncbi:hypothetical protein C8J57DRAFT_1445048 [Mycena rebaudengoi]|nr:hypothetical protein C8J57DRAFT_1445048 [Mycena rebaudengoi]
MAAAPKDLYAASVNPPRTAKLPRPRSQSESSSASEYVPEPRQPSKATKAPMEHIDAEQPAAGSKRGRKPAAMSRTAREAQRKLNHSIIEKARRTKINEALAMLRQLVPADYGQSPADEDAAGADGDYVDGEKAPKKAPGKREEKEKEFKLEILVRTVSFVQDLLGRVAVLEGAKSADTRDRKRPETEPEPEPLSRSLTPLDSALPQPRLPSIASWLPDLSQIDPVLRPSALSSPQFGPSPTPTPFQSYLPSPPSSTHFVAARAPAQQPPALSLGPLAMPSHTPEDESAASLLLEISASSPTPEPQTKPSQPKTHSARPLSALYASAPGDALQAQTPSSLLGITRAQ